MFYFLLIYNKVQYIFVRYWIFEIIVFIITIYSSFLWIEGFDAEALLEEERQKMREQYDLEMNEMRQKMESEKQTKEKMANEVELMKQQYEEKLKALEQSAKAGTLSRQNSNANVLSRQQSVDPQKGLDSSGSQPILNAAMLK